MVVFVVEAIIRSSVSQGGFERKYYITGLYGRVEKFVHSSVWTYLPSW
jgi:hypothetical protein